MEEALQTQIDPLSVAPRGKSLTREALGTGHRPQSLWPGPRALPEFPSSSHPIHPLSISPAGPTLSLSRPPSGHFSPVAAARPLLFAQAFNEYLLNASPRCPSSSSRKPSLIPYPSERLQQYSCLHHRAVFFNRLRNHQSQQRHQQGPRTKAAKAGSAKAHPKTPKLANSLTTRTFLLLPAKGPG